MRQQAWLAGVIAVAVEGGGTASACPRMDPHDIVLTPAGATVYESGGVIVQTAFEFGNASDQRAEVGGKRLTQASYVAPQLSVYAVAAGTTSVDVTDEHGKQLRQLAVAPAPKDLPLPAVKRLVSSANKPRTTAVREASSGVPQTVTTIELSAAPPADAYALLVFDTKDASARAWLPVDAKSTKYMLYTGGKSCGNHTAAPTYRGDTVRFAWLDRGGRVSPLTKPIRVGK